MGVASADGDHVCAPDSIVVKAFWDSKCEKEDADLSKNWQEWYNSVTSGKCFDLGSDAGYSMKYGCYEDGFHEGFFSDHTCTEPMPNSQVTAWDKCTQQGKLHVILSQKKQEPFVTV